MPADVALFLDRDGVINVEAVGSYILRPEQFVFLDGALDSLSTLARWFKTIIVVTNQRGVGRGLMAEADLNAVHEKMLSAVQAAGGRIDRIYSAIGVADGDPLRKPAPGMALQAAKDFPQIRLERSIMVGNTMSDMEFGKGAGMHTVFITTKHSVVRMPHPLVDEQHPSLAAWAASKGD